MILTTPLGILPMYGEFSGGCHFKNFMIDLAGLLNRRLFRPIQGRPLKASWEDIPSAFLWIHSKDFLFTEAYSEESSNY